MTNVFAVVGEHREEPEQLLLLGDDGRYYAYAADRRLAAIEPDADWRLDDGRASAAEPTGGTQRRAQSDLVGRREAAD